MRTLIGLAVAAALGMFGIALWALIYAPGDETTDVIGMGCAVLLLVLIGLLWRVIRPTTPTPLSVFEGCASNHREDGNDL